MEKLINNHRDDGYVAIFGVSREDGSLEDLLALHHFNGMTAVAGMLELLPHLFPSALPSNSLDELLVGSLDVLSVSGASRTSPVLHPSIDWSEMLKAIVDESGEVSEANDFTRLRYPQSEGQFAAVEVWIGRDGSSLDDVFSMFVYNAMCGGDERQQVETS